MLLSAIFAATAARRRANSACLSASENFGAGGVTRIDKGPDASAVTGEENKDIARANTNRKAQDLCINNNLERNVIYYRERTLIPGYYTGAVVLAPGCVTVGEYSMANCSIIAAESNRPELVI